MRVSLLALMVMVAFGFKMCGQSNPPAFLAKGPGSSSKSSPGVTTAKPDFDKDIKPILQSRCQPCHFQGGKVYDRLPFDRPETIMKLGEKLFTRIKDEKEQRLIREFLAAQ